VARGTLIVAGRAEDGVAEVPLARDHPAMAR
jgi:hypothetical protein